ncbi:hypothetical protein BEWA_007840 [Theileria equi strain WA]|uniref:C3H1-type domain-containing protein n=1 Tax=Theileria equi strain WA TaxID=1537102 RepID=L0B0P6_THEEQ|nr:hypothetical protein BEWA_007840 [Theileria equi strain WA]AFZ81375.1 hypothetical protein BEWA_007840 [Theileria equi strain WA]|eukprot:XP_004831041.1 hypothetical protein BEWA_007840 [Theileria equi strain WA]
MVNCLTNRLNIPHYDDELLCKEISNLTFRQSHDGSEFFSHNGIRDSADTTSSSGLDGFSHGWFPDSQMKYNEKGVSFSRMTTFTELPFGNTLYGFSRQRDDKHSDNIAFFRDLKDLLTQNLVETLRTYVNDIYQIDISNFKMEKSDNRIAITHDELHTRALIVLKKCILSSTEINVVQVYLALREKYIITEHPLLPSIGSSLHSNGYCKPCVFANKKSNYCKSGFNCNFCHYHHKIIRRKINHKSDSLTKLTQSGHLGKLAKLTNGDDNSTSVSQISNDGTPDISNTNNPFASLSLLTNTTGNSYFSVFSKYSHNGPNKAKMDNSTPRLYF